MSERTNVKWPFQSFWFGETLSPYEKTCLRSFVDHGHSFHLYSYSKDLEVPSGVRWLDANQIIRSSEYFTYNSGSGRGSHAAFSNLFRYKLLAEQGGWWVDTDVICLTSDVPDCEQFFAFQSDEIINGAVLLFQPKDPLISACYAESSRIRDKATWGQIGPFLMTRMVKQFNRSEEAMDKMLCYPVHYREALDLLDPSKTSSLQEQVRHSSFLHLWNEMFRRANIVKSMLPPRGSLLRLLVDRHPVDGWLGEYSEEAVSILLQTQRTLEQTQKELLVVQRRADRLERQAEQLRVKLRIGKGFGGSSTHPIGFLRT